MPDDRPLPLTGEERIEPHPTLGEPLDNFPSRRLPPILIAGLSLVGVSLLFNIATYTIDTSAYAPVIVGVYAVLTLVAGWWVLHNWNREVILYARGLTYREGSKDVPFRYDEFSAVRLRAEQLAYFGGFYRRTIYRITLTTFAGDVIVLNNIYNRVEQLGDTLNQRVTALRRPQVYAALEAGHTVFFTSDLSLGALGLTVRGEALEGDGGDVHLPWDAYGGYNIAARQLRLYTVDGALWFSLPLYEVDNLLLLIELLREHQPSGEGKQR
jgi:hypothetical protein